MESSIEPSLSLSCLNFPFWIKQVVCLQKLKRGNTIVVNQCKQMTDMNPFICKESKSPSCTPSFPSIFSFCYQMLYSKCTLDTDRKSRFDLYWSGNQDIWIDLHYAKKFFSFLSNLGCIAMVQWYVCFTVELLP